MKAGHVTNPAFLARKSGDTCTVSSMLCASTFNLDKLTSGITTRASREFHMTGNRRSLLVNYQHPIKPDDLLRVESGLQILESKVKQLNSYLNKRCIV